MKIAIYCFLILMGTCNAKKENSGKDMRHANQDSFEQSKKSVATNEPQNSDYGLNFISGDAYSGQEEAETLIITDAKSLEKFYLRVNRTRKPGLPIPDIDFTRDLTIVRCSGRSNSEEPPKLYVMEVDADTIILGIEKSNKENSNSAVTTPFAIYRMPLMQKEILVRD